MPDVFISHSAKDKNAADAVCAILEQSGIRCWVAPRDVPPGAEWADAILHGIESSRVMLIVFSQHANESPQVRREVERAVAKGLILLPFRIEDVRPTKAMEYFISAAHWLDAITPPLHAHLDELANTVSRILGRERKSVASGGIPIAATRAGIQKPPVFASIVSAILIGCVVGFIARNILIMRAMHFGFVMFALLAIAGSIVGGLIARISFKPRSLFHPASIIMSVVGAIVILFIVGKFS